MRINYVKRASLMKNKLSLFFFNNGKISRRFRNINALSFAIVAVSITIIMVFMLGNITETVSKDYARLYSSNTVGTLESYFGGQIALVKKAARSNAIIEWFADEENPQKKLAAHEEMMEIINSLPSKNLYLGIEKTLHEFTVEENFTVDDIRSYATLEPGYFDDAWYFECISSDKDYLLNVDIDKILKRKRVWLNCKVSRNGTVYGAICTWLEFSGLVEELFSEYDSKNMRGLVIDEKGTITMDSALLGDDNFLHYSIEDEKHVDEEFSDAALLSGIHDYLQNIDGYFDFHSPTVVIELTTGKYRYMTIAPIAHSTWSVITFYNDSSLFSAIRLLPIMIAVLAMFVLFIVMTNFTGHKLIFEPFDKLTRSIKRIKVNTHERVYGLDRHDEIGEIANTVQDMKDSLMDALDKVHYDVLTGIYNRRFLEENLSSVIKKLSRSKGMLSIIMVDVDFFKNYNDTYGHGMGDDCLKAIANALVNGIGREDDFAARYGGEEFVVVLPNTDKQGAHIVANKLLENVRALNILHETSSAAEYVTVSLGITTGNVLFNQSAESYLKRADKALYISKQTGKDKYTFIDFE